jgi:hypothetical protein
MLTRTDDEWRRIELEARDQVTADLIANERTPLRRGEPVAWTDVSYGRTEGFTLVHRAEAQQGDSPMTLCGEVIPPLKRRAILSPALARVLGRCRYCDDLYLRSEDAA